MYTCKHVHIHIPNKYTRKHYLPLTHSSSENECTNTNTETITRQSHRRIYMQDYHNSVHTAFPCRFTTAYTTRMQCAGIHLSLHAMLQRRRKINRREEPGYNPHLLLLLLQFLRPPSLTPTPPTAQCGPRGRGPCLQPRKLGRWRKGDKGGDKRRRRRRRIWGIKVDRGEKGKRRRVRERNGDIRERRRRVGERNGDRRESGRRGRKGERKEHKGERDEE